MAKIQAAFLVSQFLKSGFLLYSVNIYANQHRQGQHRNNPNLAWFPTFDIQNSSEVVQTQVAQNRGLTLGIIIPDVCQVPVSMLSFRG